MSEKSTLLTKILQNHVKMFLVNLKNIYYYYSVWQESYDKIKTIIPNIKFTRELDVFNIIEPDPWLFINYLAESIEEWSQEMFYLFTLRCHYEKISVTVALHNFLHQGKCRRTLVLNCFLLYHI